MQIRLLIILLTLLALSIFKVKAQSPNALYYLETIPQTSRINPAMQPRANGFFALPSVNQLFQSDVAFRDIFQDTGDDWVTPLSSRYDYSDLYRVTGSTLYLNEYLDVDLFGLGFRSGRDYFTFALSFKNVTEIGFPSDLFKITEKGFADGETFNLSTMRLNQIAYKELSFGYSREFTDKLTAGINVKPIFGMVGGKTDINRLELQTNRTHYDMIVDGTIYSSAPIIVEEGEPGDFPEDIRDKELEDDDIVDYFTWFKNPGVGFDLGAVYDYSDQWSFSFALNNLGFISWNEDLNSLSFNGEYRFDGLNVDGSNKDDLDEAVDDIVDSIKTVIHYDTGHKSFNSSLTPSLYFGAEYNLTNSISFGALSRTVFQKYSTRQDFNLSANLQPYSFVALNLNYSVRVNGSNGMGTGLTFLAGPLQIYMLADYIPLKHATVYMDDDEFTMFPEQQDFSFKFGLNFIFGRHGYSDEPMLVR
ncbi:DUF5723 family protein [Marinilabiliaceae bacterium ANBcel2]|nr:DUF5723 family protein [Marinilabiliaceae bacterium ANBcel2]